MEHQPYYLAYEKRYQAVYDAGIDCWGHRPDDENLIQTLTTWVEDHQLRGKKIIEFACGEGACGVILAQLGCVYHGVDIAPSALEKAKQALAPYPNAVVSQLDMVQDLLAQEYDAALDCMGFHMLVLDSDRSSYLRNAFNCLKPDAPMLFYCQSYNKNAYAGTVESFAQWLAISGSDYVTPEKRSAAHNGCGIEVNIPLVPARNRSREGYFTEITNAGFVVDGFIDNAFNVQNNVSATIFVHKP